MSIGGIGDPLPPNGAILPNTALGVPPKPKTAKGGGKGSDGPDQGLTFIWLQMRS